MGPTGGINGVEQDLGRQPLDVVVRVEATIPCIFGEDIRTELVDPGPHDRPHQLAEGELALDQVITQGIEKFRVRCGIGRPHVIDGLDESRTHVIRPDAIDDIA